MTQIVKLQIVFKLEIVFLFVHHSSCANEEDELFGITSKKQHSLLTRCTVLLVASSIDIKRSTVVNAP